MAKAEASKVQNAHVDRLLRCEVLGYGQNLLLGHGQRVAYRHELINR